jgi:hypothetical protein
MPDRRMRAVFAPHFFLHYKNIIRPAVPRRNPCRYRALPLRMCAFASVQFRLTSGGMDMTLTRSRAIAAVTAAALALTSVPLAPALAAPVAAKQAKVADADAGLEFSSRRRYHRRGDAAAAAAFAAIVGGIATYAAAREYRKAREREYRYRYGYYGAPYGYYGGYYVPRRHWHRW